MEEVKWYLQILPLIGVPNDIFGLNFGQKSDGALT